MKKSIKIMTLVSLFVMLAFSLMAGIVSFAKYVGDEKSDFAHVTEKFFFSSALIAGSDEVTLFGGGTKILNFDVRNFEDELRVSPGSIFYGVSATATNGYSALMIQKDGEPIASSTLSLTGATHSTDVLTLVCPDGYDDGTIVSISIVSTAPYSKTLSLSVCLRTIPQTTYSISDSSGDLFCTLSILSVAPISAGVVEIEWNAEQLLVDVTNAHFQSGTAKTTDVSGNYNSFVLGSILQNSAISIKLFKVDTAADYSVVATPVVGGIITV